MIILTLQWIFWLCIGAIAYSYIGYPIALFLLVTLADLKARLMLHLKNGSSRAVTVASYQPTIAVLVSAFNEESVIGARVRNLLETNYPSHLLEILVGLDSPTDKSAEALSNIRSPRLRVIDFSERRGKLAVLRDLAERSSAEIFVLTDAETMFAPDCVGNLARHFSDPRVGVVGGELRVVSSDGTTPVESLYWRYELSMKLLESRLNCVLGAVGANYAVRRSLFRFQKPSFAEDFQLPMEIRHAGYRVVYDSAARAIEGAAPTFSAEFRRRVRIGAADYQILFHNPQFLNPIKGMVAFSYFSHKVLRWLGPLFLAVAFACNVFLISSPVYLGLLLAQAIFYALAVSGYWMKKSGREGGIASIPLYFSAMNLALFCGMLRYLSGRQKMAWDVTPR